MRSIPGNAQNQRGGTCPRTASPTITPMSPGALLPASERIHQPEPQCPELGPHRFIADRGGFGHGSMNKHQLELRIDVQRLAINPAHLKAPFLTPHRPEVVSVSIGRGRYLGGKRRGMPVPVRGFEEI